jgi:hypothetical protein
MLTIYVIYHITFENTNIFTTDKNRIEELTKKMAEKYETKLSDWYVRTIVEENDFEADMDMVKREKVFST